MRSIEKQQQKIFPLDYNFGKSEVEMQEDHSVLSQAKEKIIQAREFIESLDEELQQGQQQNNNDQTIDQVSQVQDVQTDKVEEVKETVKNEQVKRRVRMMRILLGGDKVKYLNFQRIRKKSTQEYSCIYSNNEQKQINKIRKSVNLFLRLLKCRRIKMMMVKKEVGEKLNCVRKLQMKKVMNDYVNYVMICIRIIKMKSMNYLSKGNDRFKKLQLVVVKELLAIRMQVQLKRRNFKRKKKYNIKLNLRKEIQLHLNNNLQFRIIYKTNYKNMFNNCSFLQIVIDDEENQQHRLEYQKQILQRQECWDS
ncbi:unnamed protein product (macronuclear) [Paramecium tetraurelia]|uniref:Uncharacterized protein n=1 Tax=Paramecium tetraurelia TaxID=5888 RepID=A0DP08_PARTE|nr:uncharacterized protein GSPATT00018971001 [Paramecium tetraurelia]CAK84775.1 unnamed protein product [Paramecium tetraurelia]|eukprot:XP_001452172.1 hypothetical protein (macronuclear) [Paramecium tetraurelia strain d4-2]